MLLTFFSTCLMFVFAKIIIHDWQFHFRDGLVLIALVIVSWTMVNTAGLWETAVETLILGGFVYIIILDFYATVVVTVESLLLLLVISQLTMIISPWLTIQDGIPIVFFLLGLSSVLGLYFFGKYQPIPKNKTSSLEALLSSFLLIVIYGYIILVEYEMKSVLYTVLGVALLILFGLIVFELQRERNQSLQRKQRLSQQQDLIASNTRYTQAVEKHYDDLRKFRHDYQNVMLSLDEYLKTDDLKGLKVYYRNSLAPMSTRLTQEKYQLEDISRIDVKEIKSVLFNKLNYAQSLGITVHFESHYEVPSFFMNSFDLVVVLGILLDNAIEAAMLSEKKLLNVTIIGYKDRQVIIVENSFAGTLPPLWRLEQSGFSTKGENRGLGLPNLYSILKQYNNVSLATEVDEYFKQELSIKDDKKND